MVLYVFQSPTSFPVVLLITNNWVCVSGFCPSGEIRSSENTYFCQAARQLSCVPSSQLCVKLASGGDPTYAFNIRFTGEEVHGTSESFYLSFSAPTCSLICFSFAKSGLNKYVTSGGSFRHFLWQVCKELQSSALSLLLPCPSAAANRNKVGFLTV